jgi:hypothetical protein
MAQQALPSGRPLRRRALFGLLDADGWSWASVKGTFWFVVLIMVLGYIPDRAYYFTVFPTIDLGILAWSPINLCPPENEGIDCPAPAGAVLPWHPSPGELRLPAGRTDGAAVQVGTDLLYVGGSDGTTASADVYRAKTVGAGNFGPWEAGPPLPAPRTDAAVAFVGGSVFVVGGLDETGTPTTTTFVLTPDPLTGELGDWRTSADAELELDLPEGRAASAIVPVTDGVVLIGGDGPSGPTQTVYKSTLDSAGALGPWQPQAPLYEARSHGVAAQVGDFIWLYGGTGADGKATRAVQRGTVNAPVAASEGAEPQPSTVGPWGVAADPVNLPEPRSDAAGFTANGALYLVGGADDAAALHSELYWSIPTASGSIPEWKHLPKSDLPTGGLAGAAPVVLGGNAILVGGRTGDGAVLDTSARANLAPQPPFFQLGILGMTIPGLKIEGEVGQQLGWINAATIGAINFIILLLVGWAFAHKERTREIFARLRRRGD